MIFGARLVVPIFLISFNVSFNTVGVFICKGPKSMVYHKSERCKGLLKCSTKLFRVSLSEAKRLGRRACMLEFR
jgi:hypothetical protein